jgi:hypothetical protein
LAKREGGKATAESEARNTRFAGEGVAVLDDPLETMRVVAWAVIFGILATMTRKGVSR